MQTVLIQDMAALIVFGENCPDHSIFDLELFRSPEFWLFAGKMQSHPEVTKALHDVSLQEVLPGVQEQFDAINSSVHVVADKCQEMDLKVEEMPHKIQEVTNLALNDFLMKMVSSVSGSQTR